jgi:NAD(P)-dependent dehydrogenase (short-subunit alcohol dehydrogenase family)
MSEARRVAILTGGSGGLAPGIIRALVAQDMVVAITGRNLDPLEAMVAMMPVSATIVPLISDATDMAMIQALVAETCERFGRVDALINAAASSNPIGGAIEEVNVDALIADVDTKVGGYLRYTQAVAPVMKRQRRGQIVNIGGLTGRSSDTLSGLRNVAVAHLTKVLSDQLGPFGIAVNAVHPGIVRTPHLEELFAELARERGTGPAEIEAEFTADIPTGTILSPDEIGRVVAFLAGAQESSVTGQSVTVDGGYSRGVYL